jgi:hypothetical protein
LRLLGILKAADYPLALDRLRSGSLECSLIILACDIGYENTGHAAPDESFCLQPQQRTHTFYCCLAYHTPSDANPAERGGFFFVDHIDVVRQ